MSYSASDFQQDILSALDIEADDTEEAARAALDAIGELSSQRADLLRALASLCGRDVRAHHWDDARKLLRELATREDKAAISPVLIP